MQHKLVFIAIIIVVAGGIWYDLSQNSTPTPTLVSSVDNTVSTGSPTQDSADQQLVATLLTLRSVTLSGTIFQDPAFLNLQDFGTTIVAEPVGRENPFAPLTRANVLTGTTSIQTVPTGAQH